MPTLLFCLIYTKISLCPPSGLAMFKYEYDEEKKKKFFDFWKIKSFKEFNRILSNPKRVFFRFSQLDKEIQRCVNAFFSVAIEEKQLEIKNTSYLSVSEKITIPRNKWNTSEEQASLLEDLHFFNFLQDRAFLNDGQDMVVATEVIDALIKEMSVLSSILHFHPQPNSFEKDFSSWNKSLRSIYTSYFSPVRIEEADFLKLVAKKSLKFGLDEKGEAKLFLGEKRQQEVSKEKLSLLYEHTGLFLHQLDRKLFQIEARNHPPPLSANPDALSSEVLSHITSHFKEKGTLALYRKKGFRQKYQYLIRTFFQKEMKLLTRLASMALTAGDHDRLDLIRQINREKAMQGKSRSKGGKFKKFFTKAHAYGLLLEKEEKITLDISLLRFLMGMDAKQEVQKTVLMDSDMQLTFYKQTMSAAFYYFILSLCELNYGEYMHTATFSRSKRLFALYFGWNISRTIKHLKENLNDSCHPLALQYIKNYFQTVEGIEGKKTYLLSAPSVLMLEKAVHLLKAEALTYRRLEPPQSNLKGLLFTRKKDFELAHNVLKKKGIFLY